MHTASHKAYYLQVIFLGLVVGIGLQIAQAWTVPSGAPPTQTIGAPITTSSSTQTKAGSFGSLGILSGNVLRTTAVVSEGGACASTGFIATNASGVVLSCQGGTWKKSSGASSGGAILSTANFQTLFGGKTGSGSMVCTGSLSSTGNGTHAANFSVSADGLSLTVSAGGNINNCYGGYACNGYGCANPNGVYSYAAISASGVRYRRSQSLGIPENFDITLTTNGWSGSGGPLGGTISYNGYFTN